MNWQRINKRGNPLFYYRSIIEQLEKNEVPYKSGCYGFEVKEGAQVGAHLPPKDKDKDKDKDINTSLSSKGESEGKTWRDKKDSVNNCEFTSDHVNLTSVSVSVSVSVSSSVSKSSSKGESEGKTWRDKKDSVNNCEFTSDHVNLTSVSVSVSVSVSSSVSKSSSKGESEGKTWRDDFSIYQAEEQAAYESLINDPVWIADRQKYHPNLDIKLSAS